MDAVPKLLTLILMASAVVAGGYDYGRDYVGREVNESDELIKYKIAVLDLVSYGLTLIPLFCSVIIILNRDPTFGMVFDHSSSLSEMIFFSFLLIASIGAGLGIARRHVSLKLAKG